MRKWTLKRLKWMILVKACKFLPQKLAFISLIKRPPGLSKIFCEERKEVAGEVSEGLVLTNLLRKSMLANWKWCNLSAFSHLQTRRRLLQQTQPAKAIYAAICNYYRQSILMLACVLVVPSFFRFES